MRLRREIFEFLTFQWFTRVLIIWTLETSSLLFLVAILPGLSVQNWATAVWTILLISLLNALIWPALVYFTVPFTVLTFILFTLVFNGFIIWLSGQIDPGFEATGYSSISLGGLGLTVINTLLIGFLAIDFHESYHRYVIQQFSSKKTNSEKSKTPGVIFLEIDGLSAPVLRNAIGKGQMPTLARWLNGGSHRLIEWECDLSSQTAASQAGILHGNNFDIPAFRWYEKDNGKIMVSNHPRHTAEIEQRMSNGNGLLVNEGVSRGNMFSGDATDVMFTFSTLAGLSNVHTKTYYHYFINPYNFARMMELFIWDIALEKYAAWKQRLMDERPRIERRGAYPILRAFTTIFLRELSIYMLIGDMFKGIPSAYATFVGYDEVAHHSGIERPDAIEVLRKLDHQFSRLEEAANQSPRRYHFVVLSDHGQTQGATFRQRHDMTLAECVRRFISEEHTVDSTSDASEGWGSLNAFLTEFMKNEERRASRVLRRIIKPRTYSGNVILGPEHSHYVDDKELVGTKATEVVVLPSGNLGLIYFTDWKERLSYERINENFPNLTPGLVQHPGIGFIMVHSEEKGPMVIGAKGTHFLKNGRIEGEDPLKNFSPSAPEHLRRSDTFPHVPDILVNSVYDPQTGEVAAFEELVGSHGGLGGNQTRPFILFPSDWEMPEEKIVGATSVYSLLKSWVSQVSHTGTSSIM
jgi:putative membrane protein